MMTTSMTTTRMWLVAVALLASGLAVAKPRNDAKRIALVEAHASEPVRTVRYWGTRSWELLGTERILLWSTRNQAYLLKIDGGCNDIGSALGITIKQNGPWLNSSFDRIVVSDRWQHTIPQECRILEIRTVDVKAMKAAERAAREDGGS